MAISFVNSSTAVQNTASTTISINAPASVANGDLLILLVISNNGTWTAPSGWTEWLASANNRAIYYRYASFEPTSYTITQSASQTSSATMVAYRGAAIDVMGTIGALATPSVAAAITTTANNAYVFDFVGVNTASLTFTTPTGYTALTSDSDTTSPSYGLFYITQATAGTTGTVSSTPSGGNTARSTLFSIIPGSAPANTSNFFFMMGA
jgi:hypothetical protein